MQNNPFPSPLQILSQLPASLEQKNFIAASRNTLKQILDGKDDRLLLILGPCSIHDEKSVYEYANHLKTLQNAVSANFFIVMRTYFEKPRTKTGWKGLLNDPDLNGTDDIEKGLRLTRKILLHLADLEIPTASEILGLNSANYYADLLSWGCIGARTSSSQPHREQASSFPFPMGFKNTMEGNIEIALNGMLVANAPHTYLGTNIHGEIDTIKTSGNPYCHLVLRGSAFEPNYDPSSVGHAIQRCAQLNVIKKVLIDCSHGNSQKIENQQIAVFESVVEQHLKGNNKILGMMLESHLFHGHQKITFPLRYGVSITDSCLDWDTTSQLILKASEKLDSLKCFNL